MSEINFNAATVAPLQPEDTETNPYLLWVRECQLHNEEVQSAKNAYKCAMLYSHAEIAKIKQHVEDLRLHWKALELKPKPKQPVEN